MKKVIKFALPTILFLYEYMSFLVLDTLHFSYMLLFYCTPSLFATISIVFIYLFCCIDLTLIPGFPVFMIVANTLHIVYNSRRKRNR